MKTLDLPEDFDLPEEDEKPLDEKPLSGIIKPKLIKKKKVRF